MKHKGITNRVVIYVHKLSIKELSGLTRYKIAQKFKINISYLSKRFKKDTKMSVFQFIEFQKMLRAEYLIRARHDLTIETISRKLGFGKTEHFRLKFRKYFLLNPLQYRCLFRKR
jgi:AraC-like DNA-binding protein